MNDPSSSVSSLRGYMPSATAASTSSRQPSAVTSVVTAANKKSGTTLATVQDFPTCLLVCQCSDLAVSSWARHPVCRITPPPLLLLVYSINKCTVSKTCSIGIPILLQQGNMTWAMSRPLV
jgi:hypothetical protein